MKNHRLMRLTTVKSEVTLNRRLVELIPICRSLLGLVVIVIAAIVLSPQDREGWPIFLSVGNWTNIVRQMSEIGILALGMTLVILSAGIDLSVGSILALGATLTAKLLMHWDPGIDAWMHITFTVSFAIFACSLTGFLNGLVIARLSIQPFVVTLAAMIGFRGLARWLSQNSNIGLSFDDTHISGQFAAAFASPSVVIGVFVAMAILFGIVLSRSVFGRYVRALGDNQLAAAYAGLPIRRVQVAVYAIAGAMAGLAGVIHCAQNRQGNPNDGMAYELDAIAAVVIGGTSLKGGKGTILGTVVGTLTLGVIANILGLKGVDENVKWMAKAVIIVLAVLLQQPETFQKLMDGLRYLRSNLVR